MSERQGVTTATEVVIVRHGETVWHAENRYAGRTDIALTERGLRQAEELADWAAEADLAGLWCSPLSRCRRTAEVVGDRIGRQPRVDPRLVELDFGAGEGRTAEEMRRELGEARDRFLADPVRHHLPGGEDPVLAVQRARSALADVVRPPLTGRVLVVAHSTLLRLLVCDLLGIPLTRYRTVFPSVGNCRGARLRLRGSLDAVGLLGFNERLA